MATVLLPFSLTLLITAFVPAMLVLIALIPWRRLPAEPWTERARRLHPVRQAHAAWLLILPFTAVVAGLRFYPEAALPAVLVGAILGCTLSSWPLDRAAFPAIAFKGWFKSALVLSFLRLGWLFLVLLFAFAMPARWSPVQIAWAAAFLLASGALAGGLVHRLLMALGAFTPAGARLASIVRECSAESGIPVRGIWEISTPAAFAAALVVQRALIFSTTTALAHDDEELRAICRHELAHLQESRALIILRTAQLPVSLLPFVFTPAFVAAMGPVGIVPPLLLWILSSHLFARLSLRLEKRADHAARQGGESPAYARALERIHRHNLVPAALAPKAARTHPDLYDRMLAAGVTPDYPRPAPPADGHWLQLLGIVLNIATVLGWMPLGQ